MITTKDITAQRPKRREKLVFTTTKTIEHKEPKTPVIPKEKPVSITTGSIGDVQDIADKKKRDDIMKERKAFESGDMVFCSKSGEFVTQKRKEKTLIELIKENGRMEVVPPKEETIESSTLMIDADSDISMKSDDTIIRVAATNIELRKLNRQYVFVDIFCEDELQGFPRSLLKNKKGEQNAKRKD